MENMLSKCCLDLISVQDLVSENKVVGHAGGWTCGASNFNEGEREGKPQSHPKRKECFSCMTPVVYNHTLFFLIFEEKAFVIPT